MTTFRDRVVVITGASHGIGAACADLFRRRGAKLVLTALPGQFTCSCSPVEAIVEGDLRDAAVRQRIIETALDRFGRIDILVNNAGVGQYGYPSEVDVEVSKHLFDVNVFSALALTQLAIPAMRRQKRGAIVNIGSVGGKVGLPWAAMYCASKWALHCVSDSLRRELDPHGIHVMKVCPGIVNTQFRDHVLAGSAPDNVQAIKRTVSAQQVAHDVLRGLERRSRTVHTPKIGLAFGALEFFSSSTMDWFLSRKA